ncbi:MAG: hypothetical protein ACKPB3_03915, partial [Bacteroidota bacterium]
MRDFIFKTFLPLSIIALAVLSFQTGVVVAGNPELTQAPVGIQFLYSCTLFTLGGTSLGYPVEGPEFWKTVLYALYFIAPVVSAAAFLELFYMLSRPMLSFAPFVRKNYYIFGYGRVGRAAINKLRKLNSNRHLADSKVNLMKRLFSRFFFASWLHNSGYRYIIIDKNVRPSTASIHLFGSDEFLIKQDIQDLSIINKLSFGKTEGVFFLTDDENLNMGLLKCLEQRLGFSVIESNDSNTDKIERLNRSTNDNLKFIFIRMNTKDFIDHLNFQFEERKKSNPMSPHCFFFNTHIAAAIQLFDDYRNDEL